LEFWGLLQEEAIDWAWELVVNVWKFPPERIYATVYCPYIEEQARWRGELGRSVELAKAKIQGAGVSPTKVTTPHPGSEGLLGPT